MDNPEDKIKADTNAAGDRPKGPADPIIQARDESGPPNKGIPPAQIVPSAVRAADTTVLPRQFTETGQFRRAVPSAMDIAESMLRFKWTALVVFILVTAPAIVAIWTQVIPKYQAKGEVRVRPIIPRLVFRTDENGMIPLYDSFVNTQVSIMRSLTVLQRVLDRQEVQATQWYKNPRKSLVQQLRGSPTTPMERLRDDLSVRPRGRTEIIDVSFPDPSAKDARVIVDAVLDEYLIYIGEKSDADEDKLYTQLTDQYRSLQYRIREQEKVCADLRESLRTEDPQGLVSAKRVRLDETEARLIELRQGIAVLELQMEQEDSNDVAVTDGIKRQSKYYEDAEWRRLDIDVRTIRHNIANSILTDKHPDMARMTKGLEFAEELLRLREEQLDEQWRDRPKDAVGVPTTVFDANGPRYGEGVIKHLLAQAKEEEKLRLAEFKKQTTEFDTLFKSAQLFEKENNELLNLRQLFDAVRQHKEQKDVERGVPGSIEVLMKAFVPSRPYNDRRIVFTAMALVLGLGMGGGVAFLRARRNQAVYAPKDMPYAMQVPFLGYVPEIRGTRPSNGEPSPALTESIRVVRTTLLSRLDSQGSTAVLVTSAGSGTGKSTFALMLGKSLARAGKKVILIDADFHRMTLTKHFKNLSDNSGFIQSLRRRSVYKRHIFQTQTPGLSIVPAGKRDDNGEVLEEIANGAFKTCIGKLHGQYDVILLDSSPILPLADSTILSSQVDGVIFVERERFSSRVDINSALERLGAAGGRLLGTVFIGSSSHEKYGYGYRYGRTDES